MLLRCQMYFTAASLKSMFLFFFYKYLAFNQLDLVTYEEVVQQDNFHRKTLVLLGKLRII